MGLSLTLQSQAALSAKSYISDGLIGLYDGIENVGWGTHNPSATSWVDLTGKNCALELNPAPATNKKSGLRQVTVTENSMQTVQRPDNVTDGNAGYNGASYLTATAIQGAFMSALFTSETVFNQTAPTDSRIANDTGVGSGGAKYTVFSVPSGTGGYFVGFRDYHSNVGAPDETFHIGFTANGGHSGVNGHESDVQQYVAVASVSGQHTLTCVQSNENWSVDFDGTDTASGTVTRLGRVIPSGNVNFYVNRAYFASTGLNGHYHCLRYYDRPLSEDEIKINRAIDKVRFFGKTAAEATTDLPEGWRVREDEHGEVFLERQVRIASRDVATGAISVNGGVAGAEDFAWVEYKGSAEVSLTATPTEGYRFYGWQGAFESPNRTTASGTFTISGPVTAMFVKSGWSVPCARNYVQDGLAGIYDGIENVGWGTHNPSATSWVDLTGKNCSLELNPAPATNKKSGLRQVTVTENSMQTVQRPDNVSDGNAGYNGASYLTATAIQGAFMSALFTSETVFNQTAPTESRIANDTGVGSGGAKYTVFSMPGTSGYFIGFRDHNSNVDNPDGTFHIGFTANGGFSNSLGHQSDPQQYAKVTSVAGQHTLTCVQSNANWSVDFDGRDTASGTVTRLGSVTPNNNEGFHVNRAYFASTGLNGHYYCLRYYDRPLSKDEIMINRAVDSVRYLGVNPEALPLPEGYRFNSTDGGCSFERKYTAMASGEGTISVSGSEAGTRADVWVSNNCTSSVQVVATPNNDQFRFKRWTGSVDPADAKIANGVIRVGGDIQAEFVPKTGLLLLFR